MDSAVVIFSGGMDSTSLLYLVADAFGENNVHAVSFNYGQRHRKELDCAADIAQTKGIEHDIIDLTNITAFLVGSSLTDDRVEVPEGNYAEDTMKATVVPNRNMMMISIASAIAVAEGHKNVYTGVHAGDHFVYPDCRPAFIQAVNVAAQTGNDGFAVRGFSIEAPFLYLSKADIARQGRAFGVPWDKTWSCYKGGLHHCGRCGTCVERLEAFHLAGVHDTTVYEDSEFWKEVTSAG